MFLSENKLASIIKYEEDTGGGGSMNNHLSPKDTEKETETAEVKEFGLEDFTKFAEENSDAKLWIQKQNQKMIDKGVQTALAKETDAIRANAIAESQNMTPEAIRIAELEKRINEAEQGRQKEANKSTALAMLGSMDGIPTEAKPMLQSFAIESLVTDDAGTTNTNLKSLETILERVVKAVQRDSIHTKVGNLGNENVAPARQTLGKQDGMSNTERTMSSSKEASNMIANITGLK